jgi:hypothetical protein
VNPLADFAAGLRYENGDEKIGRALLWLTLFAPVFASAQIDPVKRDLIQFGYNQAFEGTSRWPPTRFIITTSRIFCARTSRCGWRSRRFIWIPNSASSARLGPNTDLAIGLAGGGFADSYNEIRGGNFCRRILRRQRRGNFREHLSPVQSRRRDSAELGLRGTAHYSILQPQRQHGGQFQLPADHGDFSVRTGLRWGGVEPTLFPPLAMELSVWYEGHLRSDSGAYGFDGDRELNPSNRICFGRKPRWPTRCPKASKVFTSA